MQYHMQKVGTQLDPQRDFPVAFLLFFGDIGIMNDDVT